MAHMCDMQLSSHGITSGLFDFVLVFTGPAVVPAHARAFLSSMVRAVAIDNPQAADSNDQRPSVLWAALTKAIKSAPAILESSPIVFISKERGPQGMTCRQVALHMPPFNAWGVSFRACGGGCTDVLPSDLSFRHDRNAIRCHCALCGWKSCRVKHEDVDDLVHPFSPELPLVFWHTYPPSAHLLDGFTRLTRERRD